MARLSGLGSGRIKSENGFRDNVWSDEQDCVPLKQRLKMLLASKRLSDLSDTDSEKGSGSPSTPRIDVVIKKEDQQRELQGSNPACLAQEERNWMSPEQSHADMLRDYSCQGTEGNVPVSSNGVKDVEFNASTVLLEKFDACSSNLTPCSVLSKCPVKAEVDNTANTLTIPVGNGVEGTLCTEPQAIKITTQIADDFADDLDHVVLKERRRLLLSRKSLELTKLDMEVVRGNCSLLSDPVVGDAIQHSSGREKKESHYGDAESSVAGNHANDIPAKDASDFHKTLMPATSSSILAGSSCRILQGSSLMGSSQGTKSAKSGVTGIQDNDRICSSKKVSTTDESFGGQDFVSGNPHSMLRSALSSTFVNIKAELLDYVPVHRHEKETVCSFSNGIIPVKSEVEIPEASYGDKVDHMLLRDRIKLLASKETPSLDSSRFTSESAKPIRIIRPRKRRKTATDSVETALEEDAPGLLQVLIDKGVTVNEIKLYGEPESDEALDDSEDSFSELEAVISKLFSQRQSLLKFAPLRCAKVEKASYCLACLISLVEQARYLQFRKWPVEWGWCRDLQSFIFVFERHNRIVLERPEYGYATYFFELVDSLPIHWQIKRLVTAMKLTSCSRVTLIENKPLTVGEDLTEGEARVLTEYGWIPDSGLGTMLNYCDRVVHDRKNERDNSSDWRSKIGKLLMNGYNGGTIVSTDIPKKVIGYSGAQGPQIKLEL